MHWTSGGNQSTLVLEPPVECQHYACVAQNTYGEARSETQLVDENSEEAAQLRVERLGSTEPSSRLLENITTIVETNVERELIPGDSDSDDEADDMVRIYSAADVPSEGGDAQATTPQPTFEEPPPPGQVRETVKKQVIVEPVGDFPQKPVFIQLPPTQLVQLGPGEPLQLEV
jgi:hypothetical protein